jgi:hypothetical protein
MTDDLVKRLRRVGEGAYVGAVSEDRKAAHDAADRIEKLEAALREIAARIEYDATFEYKDIVKVIDALEGKDD